LKLAPLVFIRPGELRAALWADIDLDAAEWRYTPPKTRNQTELAHIVPLCSQALQILRELHAVTGSGPFLFPNLTNMKKCMSENTINGALRRMGYTSEQMCGHGFRAMARTILDEVLCFPIEHIEQQLAHQVKDMHGRADNRT
jgi:integrase